MIKQKILTFLCAALMSVGMWAAPIVVNGVQIGNLYYNLNNGNKTAEVTYQEEGSFTNYSSLTAVNIPSSVTYSNQTYSVTSIGNGAFAFCYDLTSVTIPNSVTSIGNGAFYECSSLTITIPNSVTSIGGSAFYGCTALTSITIPNSVTSIGEGAFYGCTGLTSISIPNSVTSIGVAAFGRCTGLTSMEVASGNTNYDSRDNCKAIIEKSSNTLIAGCKNTIIPNSVTSIGQSAFYYCTGLTSVTIPNNVTSIGEYAFYWCTGLTSITIPNSVISIGERAFQNCYGLTSVTIGNSVTNIGADAFVGCSNITDVYCYADPNNLTWNDNYCNDFKYADHATECHVKSCELATYETNWGGTSFDDDNTGVNVTFTGDLPETIIFNDLGLDNQYDLTTGPLTVGNIELNFAQDNGMNIPKFYTTDGGAARIYSGNSMSISAGGATITKIVFNLTQGTPTFDTGSYNATTYTWEGEATTLTLSNEMASGQVRIVSMGVYYSDASATNPSGSCGANLSWEFDPSNGTLTITGTGAMDDFDFAEHQVPWLSSIDGITSVIIPDGVTRIGNCAFYACTALTSIEIPGSVTSIGDEAFSNSNLETVTVNATTPPTLGTDAFQGTAEGLKIYVPARSVDDYKAAWAAYEDKITTPTYTVTLKEGTEDADNWTITPPEAKTTGVAEGTEIKATYSGAKLVKSVKAVKAVKKPTSLTITDGNEFSTSLDIAGCTTWYEVIAKNSDKIKKDNEGYILDSTGQYGLLKGKNTSVNADDLFDPNATDYKWAESN